MKRRNFFTSAIAASALCATPVIASSQPECLSFARNASTVTVKGEPEQVIAFMYDYQDALWKQWRDDKRVADRYQQWAEQVRRTGQIDLWTGCDVTRKAFQKALFGGN